jgi:hypothetical protein
MDDKPKADEREPEDLEVTPEDADDVKGGISFSKIEYTTVRAAEKPDAPRGGWDGNHNETLLRA